MVRLLTAPPTNKTSLNRAMFIASTPGFFFIQRRFCLWPTAKDQGITWVVVVVLVHRLVQFHLLNKLKKYCWCWIRPSVLSLTSPFLYQLSYIDMDCLMKKIFFLILPQTLDQYWSTCLFDWLIVDNQYLNGIKNDDLNWLSVHYGVCLQGSLTFYLPPGWEFIQEPNQ